MENEQQSAFAQHLEKLELMSLATRRLSEPVLSVATAEKTLSRVWDILSRSLETTATDDTDLLGTISSIVQRTASATKQIKSLESDAIDMARKALAFEVTKKSILSELAKAAGETGTPNEISAKTLSQIEERLKLL